MKLLRNLFIHYAPIFLMFPLSLSVGLYVFREADLLIRQENLKFFY